MAEGGEKEQKGCSSTEAYEEDGNVQGGACAADYMAGPGSETWGPKVSAGRRVHKSGKSKGEKALLKRVAQLEKELLAGQVRGRSRKSPPRARSDSSSDSGSDSSESPERRRRHRSSSSESSGERRRRRSSSRDKKGKYD